MSLIIDRIEAIRVWDSRGFPTIETTVYLKNSRAFGTAIAPSGASKGRYEVVEKRDKNSFIINDVLTPIRIINKDINKYFAGRKIIDQLDFDNQLIELDGSSDKSNFGSNTFVSTSMAFAHACANLQNEPLWKYLSIKDELQLPLPEIQIFGGGAHASKAIDIQDFMIIPIGAKNYLESLEMTSLVYHAAGKILDGKGLKTGIADEGGYWPNFKSNEEGFELLLQSIELAGFRPYDDIGISVDIAASEFYENKKYNLKKDNQNLNSEEYFEIIKNWIQKYPIVSIEDPFDESDKSSFSRLHQMFGKKIQIVGDDLLVTNANFIYEAKKLNLCNAVLIKPNQIGTISETYKAVKAAKESNIDQIISARSGETEDTTIMHIAVAWGIDQIKVGSFARSERMIKWNEGIRIGKALNNYSLNQLKVLPWQ
tara:strand:+ start:2162 stop:3439 length:1278 start_codon:yes stop_codon:yes gene_type:complete